MKLICLQGSWKIHWCAASFHPMAHLETQGLIGWKTTASAHPALGLSNPFNTVMGYAICF